MNLINHNHGNAVHATPPQTGRFTNKRDQHRPVHDVSMELLHDLNKNGLCARDSSNILCVGLL